LLSGQQSRCCCCIAAGALLLALVLDVLSVVIGSVVSGNQCCGALLMVRNSEWINIQL